MMGGMRSFAPPMQQQSVVQQDLKGKGRFVELDDANWEAQFDRVGESVQQSSMNVEATKEDTVNLLSEGEIAIDATDSDQQLLKDLESTWAGLKDSLNASNASDAELAQWEAQYGSQFNDLHGDEFFDGTEGGVETPDIRRPAQWTRDNVDQFLHSQAPFPFQEENQYLNSADPYAEGLRLLAEGAPLSEAALAFEAACRFDENRGEAWKAAGETWAADEREVKGIRALEKAVACGGPDGIAAWMVRLFPFFLPSFPVLLAY
jgi:peroxin-5